MTFKRYSEDAENSEDIDNNEKIEEPYIHWLWRGI